MKYGIERRTVSPDGMTFSDRSIIAVVDRIDPEVHQFILSEDVKANFPQADDLAQGVCGDGELTLRVFSKGRPLAEYAVLEGQELAVPKALAEILVQLGIAVDGRTPKSPMFAPKPAPTTCRFCGLPEEGSHDSFGCYIMDTFNPDGTRKSPLPFADFDVDGFTQ